MLPVHSRSYTRGARQGQALTSPPRGTTTTGLTLPVLRQARAADPRPPGRQQRSPAPTSSCAAFSSAGFWSRRQGPSCAAPGSRAAPPRPPPPARSATWPPQPAPGSERLPPGRRGATQPRLAEETTACCWAALFGLGEGWFSSQEAGFGVFCGGGSEGAAGASGSGRGRGQNRLTAGIFRAASPHAQQ